MFQIRAAHTLDAQAISSLIHSVSHFFTLNADGKGAEEFFKTISPEAVSANISASNFQYWVGLDSNAIVAVIAVRDMRHLYSLYVSPNSQGKGYAKQLWQHARNQLTVRGGSGEFTVNSSIYALKMYESFGFVATDSKQEVHGLAYVPMKLS